MSELNELSELQSVDYGFGAFLAGAFMGYADIGPKGWREFIKRPINRQIFRHDCDTPEQFMRDFLASQKDKKSVAGEEHTTVNAPLFPVVYYFRKPGIVNTQDQKGSRGRVWKGGKAFRLQQLPVALDYTLVILAWDKLTIDKIQLAWYAYIASHDAFMAPYEIGSESFDVRVSLMDNKNVAMQNATDTVDGKRLYAATTPVSIMTNILMGREIEPPGPSRLIYGFARETERQYAVALSGASELAFYLDTATKGEATAINPGSVRIIVGARLVASDDGEGGIFGEYDLNGQYLSLSGTVDYYSGIVSGDFNTNPGGVVRIAFAPLQGRLESGFEGIVDPTYDDGSTIEY